MRNADKPVYPDIRKVNNNDYKGLVIENYTGLTKREYFAAMAMQGLLSNPNTARQIQQEFGQVTADAANGVVCATALNIADKLLKQLEIKDEL